MTKPKDYYCTAPDPEKVSGVCGKTNPALFDSDNMAWSHRRCTEHKQEIRDKAKVKRKVISNVRNHNIPRVALDMMHKSWLRPMARKMAGEMYQEWRTNH